jgi:hypothetical protein
MARFQGMSDLFPPVCATVLLCRPSPTRTEGASDEIHGTPVESDQHHSSARLASRRPGPVRREECTGSGVLRGSHGQRFQSRNQGQPLCQRSEGKRLRRGRGYHLDASGNLLQHDPDQSLQERNLGHQPHQDLGVSGRGASSRLLEVPDDQSGDQHSSHPRDRELYASQGTRDRQQQGRGQWRPLLFHGANQGREPRHLRAAQPPSRLRGGAVHRRYQGRWRAPHPQLRFARQLRHKRQSRGRAKCRWLWPPLPKNRRHLDL